MAGLFDAPTLGLGKLLHEGTSFLVPHHQRDYSWTQDEIDQFFSDVLEARRSNQPEYFVGLMVFMPDTQDRLTILDGQQRMATTVILLSSIRTWLREHGLDRDAEKIQQEYIGVREFGEEDLEARLTLNENNNQFFYDFVIQDSPTRDILAALKKLKRYDPNRRLLESILLCRERIVELASGQRDSKESERTLFQFVKYLRDNVKVVRLAVANEANAYTVFETLNDRGLDLSVLDLVKNYLFGRAAGNDRHLAEVKQRWAQMMGNLANVAADDFLKVYWTSRNGRTQKASLFPSFKEQVTTPRHVTATSKDMLEASEQYAALEIADDPIWSDYSKETRDHIRVLKLLGARQTHPVLLAALERLKARELERLVHLLEVLIVRYQLIGGERTGRLEIACAALAVDIFRGKVTTATAAFKSLKEIYPSDKEFSLSFQLKQETNNRKVGYLLHKLEQQARQAAYSGEGPDELEPADTLTVEHILPRNPGSAWQSALQRDSSLADEYTYRLGNLCLLSSVNAKLGQESFAAKKATYYASKLILTKALNDYDAWDRDAIEDRQTVLSKMAAAAWRFE